MVYVKILHCSGFLTCKPTYCFFHLVHVDFMPGILSKQLKSITAGQKTEYLLSQAGSACMLKVKHR